jgi:hypothetical protein
MRAHSVVTKLSTKKINITLCKSFSSILMLLRATTTTKNATKRYEKHTT